jgi:16S rRNA (guanine966-N2)-methyltransferase
MAPEGRDTRPTSDRVREAIFNSLTSMGIVEGASVLDLFSGSGALGIEALSRGAEHVTFIENDRRALAVIQANLEHTRLATRATVTSTDAITFVGIGRAARGFDLVLADPPYQFQGWAELFAGLGHDAVVVAESNRAIQPPEPWKASRQKRYGGTWVTICIVDGAEVG